MSRTGGAAAQIGQAVQTQVPGAGMGGWRSGVGGSARPSSSPGQPCSPEEHVLQSCKFRYGGASLGV